MVYIQNILITTPYIPPSSVSFRARLERVLNLPAGVPTKTFRASTSSFPDEIRTAEREASDRVNGGDTAPAKQKSANQLYGWSVSEQRRRRGFCPPTCVHSSCCRFFVVGVDPDDEHGVFPTMLVAGLDVFPRRDGVNVLMGDTLRTPAGQPCVDAREEYTS